MKNQLKFIFFIFFVFSFSSAFAVPFTNGDFSSGMTAWADASFTGSASVSGGGATLETGAFTDPFSSVLVQGDDGFFTFGSPVSLGITDLYLNFDASFIDLGIDATEAGGSFFGDALFVSIYDEFDFFLDTTYFGFGVDSSSAGAGPIRYNLDVSSFAGRTIALSFELSDEDDGHNSKVALDNVSFSATPVIPQAPVPVPLPNTIALFLLGLFLMAKSEIANKYRHG